MLQVTRQGHNHEKTFKQSVWTAPLPLSTKLNATARTQMKGEKMLQVTNIVLWGRWLRQSVPGSRGPLCTIIMVVINLQHFVLRRSWRLV